MALVPVGPGMVYPFPAFPNAHAGVGTSIKLVDAATEKAALIGHLRWADGGSHTISASGAGKIAIRTATVTWADSGTSVNLGIQGVDSTSGPPALPDGTWLVYATLVPGTETMSSDAWNTYTMETGSATLATGDLISVVMDMTARGGTDAINWYALFYSGVPGRPMSNVFLSGAWQTTAQNALPVCYLMADDGTLGVIYSPFGCTFADTGTESYSDSSNPDERGLLFTPAVPMRVEGFLGYVSGGSAAADWSWSLYTSPLSSPTAVVGPVSVLGEQLNANSNRLMYSYSAPYLLSPGTQYCLAVKGTGTGNITMQTFVLPDAGLRAFIPGTTTVAKATRNDSTGAFIAESPAVSLYAIGLVVTGLDDGSGGGGGGAGIIAHPGMRGGFV